MEASKANCEGMYRELEVRLKDSEETNKRLIEQNEVLQRALADLCGEIKGLKFAIEHFKVM